MSDPSTNAFNEFGNLTEDTAVQTLRSFLIRLKLTTKPEDAKKLSLEERVFAYMVLIRIPSLCGIESQLTVMTDLSFNTQERCSFTYCE